MRHYRRLLLSSILENCDADESVTISECLKKINLKDVVYWSATAWNNVSASNIQRSWNKILIREAAPQDQNDDSEDNAVQRVEEILKKIPGYEDINQPEIEDWINSEKKNEFSDEDFVNAIREKTADKKDSSDEETSTPRMTHTDGLNALETALKYVEQQPEAQAHDLLLIKRWRDIAARKRLDCRKQKSIADFFVRQ